MLFILMGIGLGVGVGLYLFYRRRVQQTLLTQRDCLVKEIAQLQQKITRLSDLYDNNCAILDALEKEKTKLEEEIRVQKSNRQLLESAIDDKKVFLEEQLKTVQSTCAAVEAQCAQACEVKKQQAAEAIEAIDSQAKLAIEQKREETQKVIQQLSSELELERAKYLSILETIRRLQPEEEQDVNRHIIIQESAREDINYLLNNVAGKLSNPDILYKLIWSEYVQKPTNTMLDYILPRRDCSGIYKITNDKNKKAYIGRSISVRKRLSDHIKSTIGITTIADQKVHQEMREIGLWNFTFELIEECEKDRLNEREKFYIDFFATEKLGYNQKAGG